MSKSKKGYPIIGVIGGMGPDASARFYSNMLGIVRSELWCC